MDHEVLIERVRRGDLTAFEELVRRKQDRAFHLARLVVGNDEDARDVVQLALIRVWRKIRRYRGGSGFDPWLHRIVVNLAIDFLRRETVRRRRQRDAVGDASTWVGRSRPPEPEAPRGLQRGEVARIFDELSGALPARQRAIFALREIEGMSSVEVARLVGVRPSTVRNHLFQARRALQRALRSRYPEYLPARLRRPEKP